MPKPNYLTTPLTKKWKKFLSYKWIQKKKPKTCKICKKEIKYCLNDDLGQVIGFCECKPKDK